MADEQPVAARTRGQRAAAGTNPAAVQRLAQMVSAAGGSGSGARGSGGAGGSARVGGSGVGGDGVAGSAQQHIAVQPQRPESPPPDQRVPPAHQHTPSDHGTRDGDQAAQNDAQTAALHAQLAQMQATVAQLQAQLQAQPNVQAVDAPAVAQPAARAVLREPKQEISCKSNLVEVERWFDSGTFYLMSVDGLANRALYLAFAKKNMAADLWQMFQAVCEEPGSFPTWDSVGVWLRQQHPHTEEEVYKRANRLAQGKRRVHKYLAEFEQVTAMLPVARRTALETFVYTWFQNNLHPALIEGLAYHPSKPKTLTEAKRVLAELEETAIKAGKYQGIPLDDASTMAGGRERDQGQGRNRGRQNQPPCYEQPVRAQAPGGRGRSHRGRSQQPRPPPPARGPGPGPSRGTSKGPNRQGGGQKPRKGKPKGEPARVSATLAQRPRLCYNCGMEGHLQANCPNRGRVNAVLERLGQE